MEKIDYVSKQNCPTEKIIVTVENYELILTYAINCDIGFSLD